MKKMNKNKILFLTFLTLFTFHKAGASDRQPDSNGESNYLYTADFISLDPTTGLGTLEIRLDNITNNFNSYQLDLYLEDGFEISKTSRGAYEVKPNNGEEDTSKTVDHVVTVNIGTGFYRIVSYSPTMQYILPGDDILLTVIIKAPENYNYDTVAFAQIKNITFAAGTEGHSFQDIEFEMEEPIALVVASGDEEMWDKEWKEGKLDFPLEFLYEATGNLAEIKDTDMDFILTPLFDSIENDGTDSFSLLQNGIEGVLNIQVPEPGLYEVSASIAKGKRYTIDGKKTFFIKKANVYPSLEGFSLSYVSMTEGGNLKEFTLSDENEIKYQFEISEGTVDWYHENAKNPKVSITENDVEIWYRLHGLDDIFDPTPDKPRRIPATPETSGYLKASEDNSIYIGKLAYAPEYTSTELSLILKKNGAATPLIQNNSDGKSEQLITISKSTNVETGLENISVSENIETSIFTLQGVCVKRQATKSDIDSLSPGVYVIGGKKVIVK